MLHIQKNNGQDLVLYQSWPKYGATPDPPFMCSTEYNSDNLEAAKQCVALMGVTTPYPYHCLAWVILIIGSPLSCGSGW